jgi:glycerol-3-phosphate dehydrogenase
MNSHKTHDVIILGAGIVGCGIAYELSKYKLDIAMVDKADLASQGTSKGNSGILHAGYDDPEGSLRGRLVVEGNRRYDDWSRELGVSIIRPGSFVVAFDENEMNYVRELYNRGIERGIGGLELLDAAQVREAEPNLNPSLIGALYAGTAGSVCPMRMVNFLFKNAVINGMSPYFGQEVLSFDLRGDEIVTIRTDSMELQAKLVINATGVHADEISAMAGIDTFSITPRKGEYLLLEPHPDYNVNHIIFPTPSKESKGALVIPTATGDILIGPTAHDLPKELKDDKSTSVEGLREVIEKTKHLVPGLYTGLTVKTFAGNRAQPSTNDFIIERYENPKNFINAAGIKSPGLTAAPAIADMVVGLVKEIFGSLPARENYRSRPFREYRPWEEALHHIEWADTLTPHLDSPPLPLLDEAWDFGIKRELYNYSCFTDRGLGVDLGSSFQNELISYLQKKGTPLKDVVFRENDSVQVEEKG